MNYEFWVMSDPSKNSILSLIFIVVSYRLSVLSCFLRTVSYLSSFSLFVFFGLRLTVYSLQQFLVKK